MVAEVINEQQQRNVTITGEEEAQPTPQPSDVRVKAYLLALQPQDALVLKHLKDSGATFDMVVRSPTSNSLFELSPVTSEYIVDRYQLEVPR
jgi:pilus assembly protein CpaB